MKIEDHLVKLKEDIDNELREYFECKIEKIKKKNDLCELVGMTENLEKFILSSGKRIRPILFYYGYILANGKNIKEILKTSISIEFIHSYFLIHDDIIDRDDFRHGNFSMHHSYAKKAEEEFKNIDSDHFGISMGIIVGDLSSAFGYEILNSSKFKKTLKTKALSKLDKIICDTIFGQALDLNLEQNKNYCIDEIFEMQTCKTAKYTIEGPLHLGAILAGADNDFLDSLSKFAIPLGIAFQIQDDIIGVFGDKVKIGKPVGSDIMEGKKTLLLAKAVENADDTQKKILDKSLGNKNISIKDIDNVKDIIINTGSLEFSNKKALELVENAKKEIKNISISKENVKFLNNFADFIVNRGH
ncbi:MAG: polyprenyl synthetase family protein [Patescibacteria group bacterium]|nr:polyprenyl synthetase family protein [Patescibacteria group bacterium]